MGVVWSLLAVLAMLGGEETPPVEVALIGGPIPTWPLEYWMPEGEAMRHAAGLEGTLHLVVTADLTRKGRLDITASTRSDGIHIALEGDGWDTESEKAVRLLRQNLAHEIAHVAQRERLNTAFESPILHEGYAEARSLDLLKEANLWTNADIRRARLGLEQRCETALRRGPLLPQIRAGDRDANYACGAVLWFAAAELARTTSDVLHRSYARAAQHPAGLGLWARETLGDDFTRSAWRFVTADYSGGPQEALEGLPAGRL